jgi:hypothetical protein
MKPFNQSQIPAYNAEASNIAFNPGVDEYNVDLIDNPQRKQIRFAVAAANIRFWRRIGGTI